MQASHSTTTDAHRCTYIYTHTHGSTRTRTRALKTGCTYNPGVYIIFSRRADARMRRNETVEFARVNISRSPSSLASSLSLCLALARSHSKIIPKETVEKDRLSSDHYELWTKDHCRSVEVRTLLSRPLSLSFFLPVSPTIYWQWSYERFHVTAKDAHTRFSHRHSTIIDDTKATATKYAASRSSKRRNVVAVRSFVGRVLEFDRSR